MQALIQSHRTSRVGRLGHFVKWTQCNFFLHIRGLAPLLVFNFRVEEIFAGGKFREIPFGVVIIFAGGKIRAKSKFVNLAKISSSRKIGVIGLQYTADTYDSRSDRSDHIYHDIGVENHSSANSGHAGVRFPYFLFRSANCGFVHKANSSKDMPTFFVQAGIANILKYIAYCHSDYRH